MRRNPQQPYNDLADAIVRRQGQNRPTVRLTGSTVPSGVDTEVQVDGLPLPLGSVGDVLTVTTDGTDTVPAWVAPAPATVAELDDVGDVNAPAPNDGDVLTWDATPGEWVASPSAGGHAAVTVTDSASIDLTLTGQDVTAAAIFGTTAGTVAEGNHTHAALYQPLDATLTDLAALADPNADRLIGWDDSAGAHAYITAGPGLNISGTTLSADIGAGSLGQMNLPRWVTGRYYDITSAVSATFSSGTYTTGTLIAVLLYVPNTNTVDRIGVGVSGAAAQTCRLGIYAMGSDGNPDALVLDSGDVSVNGTGTLTATIAESLTGGTWYWLAATFSGLTGAIYRAVPNGGPVGYATIASNNNDSFAVDRAFTYGALPNPFGTPAIRLGHVPRIGVRAG